jgi:uncharacterized protein YcfL|tara:strand:- start:168 stop:662 length:495 start_codon:yes stop_codon:yes gene_type:complete
MKNLAILLLVSVLIVSCNSNDDNNNDESFYYLNRHIEFKVTSIDGVDLLNSNNSNAYTENNIKIFNLIDNEVVEVFNQEAENPIDFRIVSPEDSGNEKYFIRVFINNSQLENAITYIEWNDTDTDTIKSNSVANGNSLVLTQAWYNNELIIDENTETLPEIIKN